MNKTFFAAIIAILFSCVVNAQSVNQFEEVEQSPKYYSSSPSIDPCPCPCPEPAEKKPVAKNAVARAGINIENNPTNCINIQLPNCPGHCEQTLPVNHGSGWTWPWGLNPNWLWLLLPLLLLAVALPLWMMATRNNNSRKEQNPPASNPPVSNESKAKEKNVVQSNPPVVDPTLAKTALDIIKDRGGYFESQPDGTFRMDVPPQEAPMIYVNKEVGMADNSVINIYNVQYLSDEEASEQKP